MYEIEKKYFVEEMPILDYAIAKYEIEQGYISNNPTIRIRKIDDKDFILTYKSNSNIDVAESDGIIVNNEIEISLTSEMYKTMLSDVKGNTIKKTRYVFLLDSYLNAELDIFHGDLEGLVIVEVEFDSYERAEYFTPPEWFGKDVSSDKRYSNSNLSKIIRFESLLQ